MHFSVDCPCCSHRYEIDDADTVSTACPWCGSDWMICNADAEPEYETTEETTETQEVLLEFPVTSSPGESTVETWNEIAIPARPRRKQSSTIGKLIPPILGGLSAIPIAIAILWYGFGRDLGNAGPTVARYVPWIVPEHLRGRGYRRPPVRPSNPAIAKDQRDIGTLGARAEQRQVPMPGKRLETQGISKADRDAIEEPKLLSTKNESIDRMNAWQRIQSMRDAWDFQPDEPWPEVQLRIVREVYRIAEQSADAKESDVDAASVYAPQVKTLLNEPWFIETLTDAASGKIEGIASPGPGDFIAWPTRAIEWVQNESSLLSLELYVEPRLSIDAWPVRWATDSVLSEELLGREETTVLGPQILFGQVESLDEFGYLIRVHAIIP